MALIHLESKPLFHGEKHLINGLRCSVCLKTFRAEISEEIKSKPKYDPSCYASLVYHHYGAGLPMYRIQRIQAAQGVPLAGSTQWDLINRFAKASLLPIFEVLEKIAAQSSCFFWDDTNNKLLSIKKTSKNCYTTVITGVTGDTKIHLFYTSESYAAKNADRLLSKRKVATPFFSMTDAMQNNFPSTTNESLLARWIICFCLVHGRRRLYEICDTFPREADFVLKCITEVYANESICLQKQMSDIERLKYHQIHSKPIMDALHIWMNNIMLYPKSNFETNGPLGQAIAYWLKRWDSLTQFLSVLGAPIDNSLSERLVKYAKLYIKNSYFYRTPHGARVGDACMSIIFTCEANHINPYEYLLVLSRNSEHVQSDPEAWMPWSYKATINATTGPPLQQAC